MWSRFLRGGALVGAVSLVLASCGGADSSSPDDKPTGKVTVDGVSLPQPEQKKIKLGLPAAQTGALQQYYAKYGGIYKDFGLDVELVHLKSGTQVTQALQAGEIQAAAGSLSDAVALTRSDPPKYIFMSSAALSDVVLVKRDIKTAEDLKGEKLAVSGIGSFTNAEALVALDALGLTEDDVTLTQVGGGADRLAALKAGSVAASLQDPIEASKVSGLGFHPLLDLADLDVGIVGSALTVQESFAKEKPNTALALTAAIYKARNEMYAHPDEVAKYWAKVSDQSVEVAKKDVELEFSGTILPKNGRCEAKFIKFGLESLYESNPALKSVDPKDACDNTFLDKLHRKGFNPELQKQE